jgi:hypothetical protein
MIAHAHQDVTRMTIDFPAGKHKQLKAVAALLGIPMKEFILTCVLEKLDDKETLRVLEEERDTEAFDRGMKSIKEEGYDTLAEVKRYLGWDD